jgi:hypothetical protein
MGLDNNKKSQGSESSYTLVAGGASASGEGNQMAERFRLLFSNSPWWYADSLNEEGSLSSSRTRSEHPRLGTRLDVPVRTLEARTRDVPITHR